MMKVIQRYSLIFLAFLIPFSCSKDPKFKKEGSQIILVWYKGYQGDSMQKALIGLEWSLSYIGALKSQALYDMLVIDNEIRLDIESLGFSSITTEKLILLNKKLLHSEEYQKNEAIDMGRYVALLLGASEHYYDFVQMPETYSDLLAEYTFLPQEGYVDNSIITEQHRILKFSNQENLRQLFVVHELDEETGEVDEYETMDIMPNGQPRFGIFDADGKRKSSTDPLKTEAGKPAKCMWCHESGVQPLFSVQNDFDGYLSYLDLYDTLNNYRLGLKVQQSKLSLGVDFSKSQDHAYAELLYICFMEPSLNRLSLEWNMSHEDLTFLFMESSSIITHKSKEYPFLGNHLYYRNEINQFSPYTTLSVSSNAREKSEKEVNHLD